MGHSRRMAPGVFSKASSCFDIIWLGFGFCWLLLVAYYFVLISVIAKPLQMRSSIPANTNIKGIEDFNFSFQLFLLLLCVLWTSWVGGCVSPKILCKLTSHCCQAGRILPFTHRFIQSGFVIHPAPLSLLPPFIVISQVAHKDNVTDLVPQEVFNIEQFWAAIANGQSHHARRW